MVFDAAGTKDAASSSDVRAGSYFKWQASILADHSLIFSTSIAAEADSEVPDDKRCM